MEYMNERTVALTKPPKADKQPSEHLKKCAKEIINHLLGLANKLNKEDRAVYKYIEKLNGSMNLVYDSSYNENGIPIEVSGVIDPDKKADEIAEAALKSNGFTKLTMAKGNSNVYYKSFSETSKVIAIVNGQKGGLLRSYSLINLYTSSSLTESTIFEGVQFLGESIVLNEFNLKDIFKKKNKSKETTSDNDKKEDVKAKEYTREEFSHIVSQMKTLADAIKNFVIKASKKYKFENVFSISNSFDKSFPANKVINSDNGPVFNMEWEYQDTKEFNYMLDDIQEFIYKTIDDSGIKDNIYYTTNLAHEYFDITLNDDKFIIVESKK